MSLEKLSYPDAPKIVAKPPGPKTLEYLKEQNKYFPQHVQRRQPSPLLPTIVWESGKGATVRDIDGNIFVDFSGGQHTASTGHSHPKVVQAISEAAAKMLNAAQWSHVYRLEASKKLVELCPPQLNMVFFQHSGTESTSHAVRLARHFTKKDDIITLHGHYHGKGYLCYPFRGGMAPAGREITVPGHNCYRCEFKLEYPKCGLWCADYIGEAIKTQSPSPTGVSGEHNVAAVMLETWRAGGTPKGYLTKLKKICEENEVLFIADEIKCGFGRTGKWWACDHENVVPDIICCSKGIGSGIPASAVIAPADMMNALPDNSEVHSFSANPVTCAAVSATIDVMKELKIVENAASVGDYMRKRLLEMQGDHKLIGNVSSKGLLFNGESVKDRKTKEIATEETGKIFMKAFEKGLLTYGSWFWTPPLVLTRKQAEIGLDILEESFEEFEKGQ